MAWARKPGHDSYWMFHRDVFRELLPPPAGRSLDVGCGEGRLPRDMKAWGYNVAGVDVSPTLIAAARDADPTGDYTMADAGELPFADGTFALVTAFMSLHDIDHSKMPSRDCQSPRSGRPLVRGDNAPVPDRGAVRGQCP